MTVVPIQHMMLGMITVCSHRRWLIVNVTSVLLAAVAIGGACGQTAGQTNPKTPAEIAQAIAHAIDLRVPKRPNVPLAFESATSHDNVVEVRYVANEIGAFPHNDAEREQGRLHFVAQYCFLNGRQSLFKTGVVVHQIVRAPDNGAPFEFTVDETACAALVADVKARVDAMKRLQSSDEPKHESSGEPKHVYTIPIRPGVAE